MKKRWSPLKFFKGFTLAELLGVIVVIGLLLLLIIPAIINGVSSREDEVEAAQNEIIFEATAEYLDRDKEKYPNISGNIYCVSIGELLDAGLLVDPVKKLVEDGNYSEDVMVEIKITNDGARSYALIEDGTGEKCTARSSEDIMITINPDNSQWAQQKTATITYPNLGGANQYTRNEGTWQSVSRSEIELIYTEDGTVSGQVIDSSGNVLADETETVEKIDRENPKVIKVSQGKWNNSLQKQVNVTMTDAKSGVSAYMISTSKNKPAANDKNWVKYELSPYGGIGTISKYLPMGTYYIYVKDRAGNVTEFDGKNSFVVKDDVPPTCKITESGPKGNNNWYIGDVKLTLSKSDKESGIGSYGLIASSTETYNSKSSVTHTSDTKGITYYGYVKDKAGNTNRCSKTFKRDATKPSMSNIVNSSGGNWTNQNVTISANASDGTSGMNNIKYSYSSNGSGTASDWDAGSSATYVKGTWSANRNDTVYLVATDNAGNQSIYNAGAVKIDKTPPNAPYVGSLWLGGSLNVNSNSCNNVGGGQGDASCDVYISTGRYSTWWFDSSYSHSDAGGSGINYNQNYWTHDGSSSDYYPNWSTSCCGNWTADSGGYNYATWITWGLRSIDNAGNVGYTTTVRFHISYW